MIAVPHTMDLYPTASTQAAISMLQADGKLKEAELLCRGALEARREALGDAHPETVTFISNLGVLLQHQGDVEHAEPLCREALESRRTALGNEHPDTQVCVSNLRGVLQGNGRLAEAEPLCREETDNRRATLGELNPETLTSVSNLAMVRKSLLLVPVVLAVPLCPLFVLLLLLCCLAFSFTDRALAAASAASL